MGARDYLRRGCLGENKSCSDNAKSFGGVTPTPTLDRIAANGLRYTNFNSTALCSPSGAALITGRNHHSMGFGVVSEQPSTGPNSLPPTKSSS